MLKRITGILALLILAISLNATITSTQCYQFWNCNGIDTNYIFKFPVIDNQAITVCTIKDGVYTSLIYGTDYTTIKSTPSWHMGGTIQTTKVYSSDYQLFAISNTPDDQLADFIGGGTIPPEEVEQALDKLTMITQEIKYGETSGSGGTVKTVLSIPPDVQGDIEFTTDDVSEGDTNKYMTSTQAQQIVTNKEDIATNSGNISINTTAIENCVKKGDEDQDIEAYIGGGSSTKINAMDSATSKAQSQADTNKSDISAISQLHICNIDLGTIPITAPNQWTTIDLSEHVGSINGTLDFKIISHGGTDGHYVIISDNEPTDIKYGWWDGRSTFGGGTSGITMDSAEGTIGVVSSMCSNGKVKIANQSGTATLILTGYQVGLATNYIPTEELYLYSNPHNQYVQTYNKGTNYYSEPKNYTPVKTNSSQNNKIQCFNTESQKWEYKDNPYPNNLEYCTWTPTGYELDESKKGQLIEVLSERKKSEVDAEILNNKWTQDWNADGVNGVVTESEYIQIKQNDEYTKRKDALTEINGYQEKTMEELIEILNNSTNKNKGETKDEESNFFSRLFSGNNFNRLRNAA